MPAVQSNPHGISSIYYIHPLLAGPAGTWKSHLERAASMGFSHVCVAPIFLPNSDIFLVDDYERTNPAIADGEDPDATARNIAALCREKGIWFHVDGAYGGFAAAVPDASWSGVRANAGHLQLWQFDQQELGQVPRLAHHRQQQHSAAHADRQLIG